MRSTLATFTKHTLVVRSLHHRCRGKAKNESNSGKSRPKRFTTLGNLIADLSGL